MNYVADRLREKVSEEMGARDYVSRGVGYLMSPFAARAGLRTPTQTRLVLDLDGTTTELPHRGDTIRLAEGRGTAPGVIYGGLLGGGLGLSLGAAPLAVPSLLLGGLIGRLVAGRMADQKMRSGGGPFIDGVEKTTVGARFRQQAGRPLTHVERLAAAVQEREALERIQSEGRP